MTDKGNEKSKEVDDIILLEDENDNNLDNVNLVDDGIIGLDGVIVPEVGMKFNDEKEMYDFYKKYSYDVGFPVRKRKSQNDDDGVIRYVVLTCSHEGRRSSTIIGSLKPQATIQTGCKARMTTSANACGICKINIVNFIQNHKTSPSQSRLYHCNRELSAHVKRRLEVNDMADFDDELRHKNIFLAYNRSREAYKEFDDVVTFNTTYLTNKYDMPFTPFVGVNHHGQSILLGCSLVSNENTETFVWLFKTWLQCMHGQAPIGIITDQDRAM
ncbi:protein FAR1-RELATED SEQUENCE 3-like [Olea europaea var. sylvestris]|uniref:protein FAR1-RELATED SEQUENCE 3-like n=1 Tax=Olea europaea var. sylvestris TaxID=158386 RepID=UPI000C1D896D|nr:protein FAR1-RELATED SEQUENCE 3-like [Olea europaea var. sylvestris]